MFKDAYPAQDRTRRCVEAFLNGVFAKSSLSSFDCELRYVPIIMPEGMRERYPSRSKLHVKEKIYDCAPQLDYEAFIDGSFEDQLREYVGGIARSAHHLARLGATPKQIVDFDEIMATAVERILTQCSDRSRH